MFIYNITYKVDHVILDEWLKWQHENYIPEIINTGLFYDHHFYQLLDQDETEGKTFITQFVTKSKNDYHEYLKRFAPQLGRKTLQKWGDRVISFGTLLQKVS